MSEILSAMMQIDDDTNMRGMLCVCYDFKKLSWDLVADHMYNLSHQTAAEHKGLGYKETRTGVIMWTYSYSPSSAWRTNSTRA